ncbi:MAG: carboxypeptidase-like regulatory domain-containing protein, partial [Acidobacteriota bacterium]
MALLFFVSLASAQEFRATLQGTVFDPNNAVVPGAEMILRNVGTSVERKTTADGEGHYIFQFLPPGAYSLTTRVSGFKTDTRDGITLSLAANVRLDVTLSLGQTSETVVVESTAVAVDAETSSFGSLVAREIIDSLPIKGHGSLTMFTLAAGVMNIGAGNKYGEDVRPIDQTNNVDYSMSGSPRGSGDVSVDGVPSLVDVGRGMNISSFVPPTDAIAEFRMQSGTLPAEYGRSGGTIMNAVIKSGANELHGSLYEYLRNSALDANLFFNNMVGRAMPSYQVNIFGGSLGGPVFLPKLYDGRNRTFFFVNYEGTRQKQAQSNRLNLPTPKMRAGDFSEVSAAIYDPYSTHTVSGSPTRDPFPGNVIPARLRDPVGQSAMNYWPQPNMPVSGSPWVGNYAEGVKFRGGYDTLTLKVDHTVGPKGQMFVRINTMPTGLVEYPYDFTGVATRTRADYKRPGHGAAVSYTHVFSPAMAMDLRVGGSRAGNSGTPYSVLEGFDAMKLGFAPAFQKVVQTAGFPSITFGDGITGLGGSDSNKRLSDGYSTSDAVTIGAGKHMFKTGGEIRVTRGSYLDIPGNGSFSFGPNQTGGPVATSPRGGFGLASLLLGFGSGSIPSGSAISWQSVYYALYFQDDYRVTSKLTLNLGLRWELEGARTERFNRTVRGFDRDAPSPLKAPGLNLRGGLTYAGVNGRPRGLYDSDWNNFGPRIGFAWSLN